MAPRIRLPIPSSAAVGVALVASLLVGACMPGGSTASPAPGSTSATAPSPVIAAAPATPRPEIAAPETAAPTIEPSIEPTRAPTPAASPVGPATPPPAIAEADPQPFAMNLYRSGDFVAQYTFEWCVGASLQMAINLATDESRTSRADQQRLWEMARDRSDSPFGGANPRGWTAALNGLGIGPYRLVSLPTMESAVATAASALRATGRPVGLVMWRGRHAWVMSGFEATADPRRTTDFDVTGVRVLDPLYPHGSTVWGRSPKPNSLLTLEQLATQFAMRDSRRVDLGVPPGWLLILPVATEA